MEGLGKSIFVMSSLVVAEVKLRLQQRAGNEYRATFENASELECEHGVLLAFRSTMSVLLSFIDEVSWVLLPFERCYSRIHCI